MSPRFAAGVRWASVDSSIARKGPISLPLLGNVRSVGYQQPASKSIPWTDNSYNCSEKQDPVVSRQGEYNPAQSHQRGSQGQDSFPSQRICKQRQKKADQSITDKSQCHEKTALRFRDAQLGEICHENES